MRGFLSLGLESSISQKIRHFFRPGLLCFMSLGSSFLFPMLESSISRDITKTFFGKYKKLFQSNFFHFSSLGNSILYYWLLIKESLFIEHGKPVLNRKSHSLYLRNLAETRINHYTSLSFFISIFPI